MLGSKRLFLEGVEVEMGVREREKRAGPPEGERDPKYFD